MTAGIFSSRTTPESARGGGLPELEPDAGVELSGHAGSGAGGLAEAREGAEAGVAGVSPITGPVRGSSCRAVWPVDSPGGAVPCRGSEVLGQGVTAGTRGKQARVRRWDVRRTSMGSPTWRAWCGGVGVVGKRRIGREEKKDRREKERGEEEKKRKEKREKK